MIVEPESAMPRNTAALMPKIIWVRLMVDSPRRTHGVAHDGLFRVLNNFAALVGFMLHAPLADLLAEGKAGKLAATSNAVCHGSG